MQGWLQQRVEAPWITSARQQWLTRWFVLKGSVLFCFEVCHPSARRPDTPPQDATFEQDAALAVIEMRTVAGFTVSPGCQMEITPELGARPWVLASSSREELVGSRLIGWAAATGGQLGWMP